MNAVSSRLVLACVSAGMLTFAAGCGSRFSASDGAAAGSASAGGSAANVAGAGASAAGVSAAGASTPYATAAAGAAGAGAARDCNNNNGDCGLALCLGGTCRAQSCFDGILNQDETDVDCGGLSGCPRCGTAQHCTTTGDCSAVECSKGICQAPSCADGIPNNAETDADCGGETCAPCADGKLCKEDRDCTSQLCLTETHTCAVPSCTDGVKNGGEPTTDCGGSCTAKCQLDDACASANDCISGACSSGHCVPTGKPIASTGWVASASSTASDTAPQQALDGDPDTCWTGGEQVPGMWFEVDMTKPRAFYSIEVRTLSVPDFGRSMRLSASLDGVQFVELRSNIEGEADLTIAFPTQQHARYLKLELLDSAGGLWWRIDDLFVLQ